MLKSKTISVSLVGGSKFKGGSLLTPTQITQITESKAFPVVEHAF